MKRKLPTFETRYQQALRTHLKQERLASPGPVSALGLAEEALAAGLRTPDLAKLHEQILVAEVLPGCPAKQRATILKQAGIFFAATVAPLETADRGTREGVRLRKIIAALSQRTVNLAAANEALCLDNARRKAVQEAFKKKEHHYTKSLKESELLKEQLRRLSREVLLAQEDERKKISRELHDVIAQALTGINIRLANLKREAALNTKGLARNIATTQRLVAKSVHMVHQFARELRPTVLDDLGLVPALHSYLKHFMERTGVRTSLTAYAGVTELDTVRRTVLYRVAQEALTNVARHARANSVSVNILKNANGISMQVHDDGISFQVQPVLLARGSKRLGLLGMRERVEMVNGHLDIESVPGRGTTITAHVPLGIGKRARQGPTMRKAGT